MDWGDFVIPFQSNSGASPIVAIVKGEDFTGIASVDTTTGRVVSRIDAFADPEVNQAFGTADDAYAVWKEYQSKDLSRFVVKAWDRGTGRVTQIGASQSAANGEHYPAPWQAPLIVGNVATWIEGSGPDQSSEVVVHDLGTGKRSVVRTGHVGWLSAVGRSIVWAESLKRGAKTELRAVDSTTLKPATLPPSLRGLRGAGYLSSDGDASAWVQTTTDPKSGSAIFSLVVSPTSTSPGRTVVTLHVGGFSPPILVTPTSVVAQISQGGIVVVDRRSGRYSTHKGVFGAARAGPNVLLSGSSTKHPTGALSVLSPADAANIESK